MAQDLFAWAPLIALVCGAAAGLGAFRSAKRTFVLAFGLALAQVAAWMGILMTARAEPHELRVDWNADLWASFVASLLAVTPYTVIGAVLSGTVVGLLRRRTRRNRA